VLLKVQVMWTTALSGILRSFFFVISVAIVL